MKLRDRTRTVQNLLCSKPWWVPTVRCAQYAVAPLFVIAIVLTIFIIKGIAPFGTNSMFYADMGQGYVPQFYRLWDVLHGSKSIFFDWDTGLGLSMIGSSSMTGLFTPFCLFFFFIPREAVASSLSIFLLLKMVVMAVTAGVFLRRTFRSLPASTMMVLAFLYAMSGYTLLQYTNIMWLDVAAVFPLLMLAFLYMMRTHKKTPYIVTLTLCLLINFYMSFMLCIFLLFAEGLYLILLAPKEKRGRQAYSVVFGTMAAFGLSIWTIVPTFIQMNDSMRTSTAFNYFSVVGNVSGFPTLNSVVKLAMLLGTELLIVLFISRACKVHAWEKDKRHAVYFIALTAAVVLQIVFENINLLWHTGSYVLFPMRYGYMLSGVLAAAAGYYASQANEKVPDLRHPRDRFLWIKLGTVNVGLVLLAPVLWQLTQLFSQYSGVTGIDYHKEEIFPLLMVVLIGFILVFTVIMTIRSRRFRAVYTAAAVLLSTSLCAWGLLPPDQKNCVSLQSSYLTKAQDVRDMLPDEYSPLDRVKNSDLQLQTNYPQILGRAAISNWTHMIPKSLQGSIKNLGYGAVYTRVLDCGGTVFSDALLAVRHNISGEEMDGNLYTPVNRIDHSAYYNNIYTLPFGVTMNSSVTAVKFAADDPIGNQNILYQAMTGDAEPLIEKLSEQSRSSMTTFADAATNSITYTIHTDGEQVLYLRSIGKGCIIHVNGQVLKVPNDGNVDNVVYPAYYNNGLVKLGHFFGDTVTIKLVGAGNDAIDPSMMSLGALSVDKLKQVTQQYAGQDYHTEYGHQSLSMTVEGKNGQVLFLPMSYDEGWSCTVNGSAAKIQTIDGNYMAIALSDGTNQIEMSFLPQYMGVLIPVSIGVLLLLVALYVIGRRHPLQPPKLLCIVCRFGAVIATIAAGVLLYVVPILYAVYTLWIMPTK